MSKQILLTCISFFFLGYYAHAQCPIGTQATIVNVSESSGMCSFELEIDYVTGSSSNTSINFTVTIKGGPELMTTTCFEELTANTNFNTTISDPRLVAACTDEIVVSYTAYNSKKCTGSACSPAAPNNEVPLLGALPVDIISFVGNESKYDKIKLEWVTASEEQNDYFMIEHSTDGRTFEEIGMVEGNGNTSADRYYSFMDNFPSKGENYYRLKQVDYDESFTYSNVISVKMAMDYSTPLILAPSITKDKVTLVFHELPKANAMIEVFNSRGINIMNTNLAEGTYVTNLDLSDFDPGMYFIRVPIGKEFVTKKFIKVSE